MEQINLFTFSKEMHSKLHIIERFLNVASSLSELKKIEKMLDFSLHELKTFTQTHGPFQTLEEKICFLYGKMLDTYLDIKLNHFLNEYKTLEKPSEMTKLYEAVQGFLKNFRLTQEQMIRIEPILSMNTEEPLHTLDESDAENLLEAAYFTASRNIQKAQEHFHELNQSLQACILNELRKLGKQELHTSPTIGALAILRVFHQAIGLQKAIEQDLDELILERTNADSVKATKKIKLFERAI